MKRVILILSLTSCLYAAHTDVSVQWAYDKWQNDPNIIFVDVRSYPGEYCYDQHIPGALSHPWNYSTGEVENYQALLQYEKILVYCMSGGRSNQAANFLADPTFNFEVYDMLGGISAWKGAGYNTVGCVDTDNDGYNDDQDNCPQEYNPTQTDSDGNGTGNACDMKCPDFYQDNKVQLDDFSVLSFSWLQSPYLGTDLDYNTFVDIGDLKTFCMYWLAPCKEDSP